VAGCCECGNEPSVSKNAGGLGLVEELLASQEGASWLILSNFRLFLASGAKWIVSKLNRVLRSGRTFCFWPVERSGLSAN
jgi:hypothetical protein